MNKRILPLSALLVTAVAGFGFPSCGTTQISVGSLVDCTSGDVNFTNWSFSAAGYTGTATIQIQVPAAGNYSTDPEIVTLRFSNPTLENSSFSIGYTATLTSAFEFSGVAEDFLAGNVPNNAATAGVFNGNTLTTDGLTEADLFNQAALLPMSTSMLVLMTGTGANPAPPPACGPPGLCGGGPIQKIDINFYQMSTASPSVPEPVTVALVGFGLVGFIVARRRG